MRIQPSSRSSFDFTYSNKQTNKQTSFHSIVHLQIQTLPSDLFHPTCSSHPTSVRKSRRITQKLPSVGPSSHFLSFSPVASRVDISFFLFFFLILGELGKLLGAQWKDMDEEAKKPYVKKADADKVRYEKAKAEYVVRSFFPSPPFPIFLAHHHPSLTIISFLHAARRRLILKTEGSIAIIVELPSSLTSVFSPSIVVLPFPCCAPCSEYPPLFSPSLNRTPISHNKCTAFLDIMRSAADAIFFSSVLSFFLIVERLLFVCCY